MAAVDLNGLGHSLGHTQARSLPLSWSRQTPPSMHLDTVVLTIGARTFSSVLSLVWPDLESLIFEGRLEGQFGVWGCSDGSADLVEDYFVPDGETVALASLTDEARQLYCDQEQAFEAVRRALSGQLGDAQHWNDNGAARS